MARDYRVPPSKYLGLPWAEWGETDYLLTQAFDLHERLTCRECGGWSPQCRGDHPDRQVQVHVTVCRLTEALAEFRSEHEEELTPGMLLWAELLPEGVEATDPLAFDPDKAKVEFEAMQKRLGLA